jgi:hypothetical protein
MTRLNRDCDDIVTDDEIADTLSEEVTADDNEDDADEEEEKDPSHSDTFQALGLSCGLDSAAGGMRAKAAASGETNS